ncbi:MAG TPA: glutamate synthase large subunit [Ktedonobacterales bacterium]
MAQGHHGGQASGDAHQRREQSITSSVTPQTRRDYPLYDPAFERDACGTGFVANISGARDHRILERALEALRNLAHRGAMDASAEASDGVGVLTQIPLGLLNRWLAGRGLTRGAEGALAAGMVFLPRDDDPAARARMALDDALTRRGARVLAWRVVPTSDEAIGERARRVRPRIEQPLALRPDGMGGDAFERLLYLARKEAEARWREDGLMDAYVASLSARTMVYKGLLTAETLPRFYPDLLDPDYTSALALFHQRYSTNTFPSWRLAQPMRLLAHNGEINTIQGNRNWMTAREGELEDGWGAEARWLRPVIEPEGSDSTSLDNALELLTRSGRTLGHALTLLAPPAWETRDDLEPRTRAFFAAQAPVIEPWDGPAALVFSDGAYVGAALDRNGLRPLRYARDADGLLVVASETGVIPLDEARVLARGRLGPGQMLRLDTATGQLALDSDVKEALATRRPYADWERRHIVTAPTSRATRATGAEPRAATPEALLPRQALHGYTHEDIELILRPAITGGQEAVWSMGDDAPPAVFSSQPQRLAAYFRQRFAQVTNPPIDSLRERLVMSLTTYLGSRPALLADTEPEDILLRLESPLLDEAALRQVISAARTHGLPVSRLSMAYQPAEDGADGAGALAAALDALDTRALDAVRAGARMVILSDHDVAEGEAVITAPLAVSAVHQALGRMGLRARVGLVAETGGVWDTHALALLIGFGANAVCPYLALETARALAGTRGLEELAPGEAALNLRRALEKGLLKILARMGLSTLESYLGAGLFEATGLAPDLIARYFPGVSATLDGLDLAGIDQRARACRDDAARLDAILAPDDAGDSAVAALRQRLADRGFVRFRRNAEYHSANPVVVKALQQAARSDDPDAYRRYAEQVHARPPAAIRDALAFRPARAIPIDEVEPAASIARRFVGSAMSLGSLSPETHQAVTLAFNMLGARSNTGEGGEDPARFRAVVDGVPANSRVKQVASGRFGVTAAYLANAEELEIKMAQGSKPGEGGQIPARKVTGLIARLRHTMPGVALISPPPHHDIYSIEDLAQLIYDLKQVNPRAAIGVKLVAGRGVGAIAAGVAKAHADYILISGHDGGTGASPLSSIKHAGAPWELGLAETQQTLRMNGLRGRVRLRVDGGFKTGRDVVIGALLGAEEYGFGTAALVALGCDMARQCHLDTCPAGIATQREDLRARFDGQPAHLVRFLLGVASEAREILASLGARSLDEILGRPDLLAGRDDLADSLALPAARATRSLTALLAPGPDDQPRRWTPVAPPVSARAGGGDRERRLLEDALPLLERGGTVLLQEPARNRDRTVGAALAGEIARRWGDGGLPSGNITCVYTGSAGQSFGAFLVPGLRLMLEGDANDYVGKGMTGGELILLPSPRASFTAHEQTILGNTALYGATGGTLLARGRAGERFAVRNSGAVAVVEGAGDHACEYMTGGVVAVLGEVGRNFAAGMSGGVAYVYDERGEFLRRVNHELVAVERLSGGDSAEIELIAALIESHAALTHSDRAASLLARWPATLLRLWRVAPRAQESANHPREVALRYAGDSLTRAPSPLVAPLSRGGSHWREKVAARGALGR